MMPVTHLIIALIKKIFFKHIPKYLKFKYKIFLKMVCQK